MEDWENEFVPRGGKDGVASNQWEGEDEDDDVKDNWEDEEEEKKAEDGAIIATEVKQKSRKKLQEIIAEKEVCNIYCVIVEEVFDKS
ncbi:eukaryotic translation initiation factor 3 subunit J-like [Photinus pyralis]|uniref:eukaryotic translation initiation factor 3 subunit J-like n=1 Tax=Photinus pyralis TaxID=7054 RepID=UPI001266F787|nr:eukaryotic translation initiation factor 3 subunit J-like [Photinus pyralis]